MAMLPGFLRDRLIRQHRESEAAARAGRDAPDHRPAARLFTPDGGAVWLLSELDPDAGIAYGLCDPGLGYPELGYVSPGELEALAGPMGLETDLRFEAEHTLSGYAERARIAGRIEC